MCTEIIDITCTPPSKDQALGQVDIWWVRLTFGQASGHADIWSDVPPKTFGDQV